VSGVATRRLLRITADPKVTPFRSGLVMKRASTLIL